MDKDIYFLPKLISIHFITKGYTTNNIINK